MAEPRRRGRPSVGESGNSTPVNLRLDASDYDRACKTAQRQGRSVSDVLRRSMRRGLREDDDEDE